MDNFFYLITGFLNDLGFDDRTVKPLQELSIVTCSS